MISGLDIICAIALLLLSFFGLRRGFLSSFLSLLLVYIIIYVSAAVSYAASQNFIFMSIQVKLAYTVLFLALFFILYIISEVMIWLFKKVISVYLLGILDPVLATILGGFKALLIMGVVFELVLSFPLSTEMQVLVNKSHFKKIALRIYRKTYPFAKETIPKFTKLFRKEIEKKESSTPQVIANKQIIPAKFVAKTVNIISQEAAQIVKEFAQ